MARDVDVNCDLGETPLLWHDSHEPDLMAHITSANVACGFHAGDPVGILQTLRAAAARGVRASATT